MDRRSLLSTFCVGGTLVGIAGCLGSVRPEQSGTTTKWDGTPTLSVDDFEPEKYVERYAIRQTTSETGGSDPYHKLLVWNTVEQERTISVEITDTKEEVRLEEQPTLPAETACKVLFFVPEVTYEFAVSVPGTGLRKTWTDDIDDKPHNNSKTKVAVFENGIAKTNLALV